MSVQEATELAQKLSNLTETELQTFAYALGFTQTEINHVEESQPSTYDVLFILLLRLRQRKPITAQKFLARVLSNCGYYAMAVKLRPKCKHPITVYCSKLCTVWFIIFIL